MDGTGIFVTVLRWAWGTLLTAIVTAVLTMFLKHGRRWFRPVQKFIRTGRLGAANARRRGRTYPPTPSLVGKGSAEPRMTVARVLSMLAQLTGRSEGGHVGPPQQVRPNGQDDAPLDLKF